MRSGRSRIAAACLAVTAAMTMEVDEARAEQVAAQAAAGRPDMPDEKSRANSLATLRRLVDTQNYRKLGFERQDEAESAQLGVPLMRFVIHPDHLRTYSLSVDPAAILTDSGQWIFPVTANGAVRCAITLGRRDGGQWRGISYGDQGFAKVAFSAVEEQLREQPPATRESFFVVEVLAARRQFLARRADGGPPKLLPGKGKLMFTWLGPPPQGAEKTQPAEAVLIELAKTAREKKGRAPGR
jgi:hypothetical protein